MAIISQFRSPVMIRSIFISSSFRSNVSKSFNMLVLEFGGRYHVTIKTTSFLGSSLLLRKDPGRGWSRDPADFAW